MNKMLLAMLLPFMNFSFKVDGGDGGSEVITDTPVPESDATAAPETVETPEPEATEPAKVFTQEELDAAIGKRLAREQRKWEREQAQKQVQPVSTPSNLSADQFETPEQYAEALAVVKAQELIAQRDQQRQFTEVVSAYHDREESAREKYDDFEQVAYNPSLPITDIMAQSIQASDIGPDVAYYLGSNPKEADRIARLSPLLQAKEIGRIEAKLTDNPPSVKKTTNAPAPINPVTPRGGNSPAMDTTDPRSTKTMSTSEWIAAENARERKKLEARYK